MHDPVVLNEWLILLKSKVSKRSSGRSTLKSWWTKRMFRTSTRLKNLRIPRSEKIGLDKAPVALRNLMEVSDICDFQSRCWSMRILSYLTLEFGYILLPRSLRKGVKLRVLDLDQNSVLLDFREILLALSQQVKILRSTLIFEQSDEIVFAKWRRCVSSAKWNVSECLIAKWRSLI